MLGYPPAPIWYGTLGHECNKNKMSSPQRKMALRVSSAYCTVSNVAIMVVAGIVPIHFLAEERAAVERDRKTGIEIERWSSGNASGTSQPTAGGLTS